LPVPWSKKLEHLQHIQTLSFSEDGRQLRAKRVTLATGGNIDGLTGPEENALAHLYIRDQWVNYASRDILWLPLDCRPPRSFLLGNVLALEGCNGNLTFIEYDRTKIADAGPTAMYDPGTFVWRWPER
jgi:hypothetical protein